MTGLVRASDHAAGAQPGFRSDLGQSEGCADLGDEVNKFIAPSTAEGAGESRDVLVSRAGIAGRAGVRLAAVSNWTRRHADFPTPVDSVEGRELFAADQVAAWLDRRRIPSNALLPTERAGRTYGQRFRAAGRGAEVATENDAATTSPGAVLGDLLQAHLFRPTGEPRYRELLLDQIAAMGVSALPPAGQPVAGESPVQEGIRTVLASRGIADAATAAPLFDRLIDEFQLKDKRRSVDTITPPTVAKLVGKLAPAGIRSAYDPYCRTGELLAAVMAGRPRRDLVRGCVPAHRSPRLAQQRLGLHGVTLDVPPSTPLVRTRERFDVVVCNPPFNVPLGMFASGRKWPFDRPPEHNANLAWPQHAWESLSEPAGRAFVLMPNIAAVSDHPNDRHIRQAMLARGAIEAVIALPEGIFADTGALTMLWLVRPRGDDRVLFIDATSSGERVHGRTVLTDPDAIARCYHRWLAGADYRSTGVPCREVCVEEIVQADHSVDPRRYVAVDLDAHAADDNPERSLRDAVIDLQRARHAVAQLAPVSAPALSNARTPVRRHRAVRLDELCELQPGPSSRRLQKVPDRGGRIRVVRPVHLVDGSLAADLDEISVADPPDPSRYGLKRGDLVCVRRGSVGRFALVDEAADDAVFDTALIRLRVRADAVDPRYLLHCLRRPSVVRWLQRNTAGSVVRSIRPQRLGELTVEMPSMDAQRSSADQLDAVDHELTAYRAAAVAAAAVREALTSRLLTTATDRSPSVEL